MESSFNCGLLRSRNNITAILLGHYNASDDNISNQTSLLVEQCPNVCPVIYGDGNPDISGIGVFISFIVQGCYFLLFGPGICTVLLVLPKRTIAKSIKKCLRLKKIFDAIVATSIFLTFSTLLATLVRLRQSPTGYETLFMVRLAIQLSGLSGGTFPVYMSYNMALEGKMIALFRKEELYILISLVNFALAEYIKTAASKQDKGLENSLIKLVAFECSSKRKYPKIIESLPWVPWQLWIFAYLCMILFIPIIAWTTDTHAFWQRIKSAIRWIMEIRFMSLVRQSLVSSTFSSMLLLFSNLLTLVFISGNMYFLWEARSTMLSVEAGTNEDNRWGFGQITAVLIWVPTTFWMLRNIIKLVPWLRMTNFVIQGLGIRKSPISLPLTALIFDLFLDLSLDQNDPCALSEYEMKRKPFGVPQSDEEHAPAATELQLSRTDAESGHATTESSSHGDGGSITDGNPQQNCNNSSSRSPVPSPERHKNTEQDRADGLSQPVDSL